MNSLKQDSKTRFIHVEERITELHDDTSEGFQEVKNIMYEDVVEITNEMVNDKDLIRREIDALKGRIYLLEKQNKLIDSDLHMTLFESFFICF
jgi:hypothetical protein